MRRLKETDDTQDLVCVLPPSLPCSLGVCAICRRSMGRATRWLRSLLGGRRDTKEPKDDSGTVTAGSGGDKRDKKRWSFENTGKDHAAAAQAPVPAPVDHGWLRSLYSETEKEQSKHAIAVAAATAAAADAAVAAAQAAVAVVRLTSQGRGTMFSGGQEKWAAVRIQTIFRAYLAKKALRALKALVKLQALVRGYLVRKQAAATLHSMQALIRAQATVRMQRSRNLPVRDQTRFHLEVRPRRSLERFDETRSDYAASFHSRRLSASMDHALNGCDESPKIVEMDPGRPKSRSRRPVTPLSECADDAPPPHSSPLRCQVPARISIPDPPRRNFHDLDWCLTGEECRFSTAQSTPRFMNSGGIAPSTPAKSVCGGDVMLRRYYHHQSLSKDPNYMAKTQSFEAKVRSQSAPKQRPEPAEGPKRLSSPHDVVEPRASLSGVRMHRSYSQAQETFSFKNAVVGRLDRSMELSRDVERDYYLQRRW